MPSKKIGCPITVILTFMAFNQSNQNQNSAGSLNNEVDTFIRSIELLRKSKDFDWETTKFINLRSGKWDSR